MQARRLLLAALMVMGTATSQMAAWTASSRMMFQRWEQRQLLQNSRKVKVAAKNRWPCATRTPSCLQNPLGLLRHVLWTNLCSLPCTFQEDDDFKLPLDTRQAKARPAATVVREVAPRHRLQPPFQPGATPQGVSASIVRM